MDHRSCVRSSLQFINMIVLLLIFIQFPCLSPLSSIFPLSESLELPDDDDPKRITLIVFVLASLKIKLSIKAFFHSGDDKQPTLYVNI